MRSNPPPPPDQGNLVTVSVTAPAVGTDWDFVVPPDRTWRLISARALFSTDANATSRFHALLGLDGSRVFFEAQVTNAFTASLIWRISYGPAMSSLAEAGLPGAVLALPHDFLLRSGDTLRSSTTSIQVGDQFSDIILRVEEWITT